MAASQRIKGISIVIGGDTTELVKALSKVDTAIRNTQSNLRDINKALKFDPTNTNLLAAKQKELADAVDNADKKLKEEEKAYKELEDKINNTPLDLDHAAEIQKNSEELEKLKLQIELDTVALHEAEKEFKNFGSVGSQQLQAVGSKMKEVGDKIKEVGDNIAQAGMDMTTKLSVPIATALGGAVKVTADFDAEMSKVQAISGATGEEFTQLRDKARELGSQTKFSATEAAQGFEYMGMAGWKTEDMLNGITGIMNLAAASGEELGTTSDIVTDALTAFGMSASDSARFADILASAATNANTNVSMMGESFKYVAPVAGSLGYSAEDVAVALGLMANSGIKADMAGTSLRNMFQRMAKPTKESQMAMDRLNLSLSDGNGNMYSFREIMNQLRESFTEINMSAEEYDGILDNLDQQLADGSLSQSKYNAAVEELNKQAFGAEGAEKARAAAMLGGTRAMSGLLAIANASTEDYEKLTNAIDHSSDAFAKLKDGSVVPLNEALASGAEIVETYNGQAEAMAATMQDNLSGDITTLKSMLQELAISIGDLLMPTLREIVTAVQNVVTWLNNLDEGTKKTIVQIALVIAAIGPVLLVIGKVVSAVGTVISVIGTITSAIGAILPVLTTIGGVITGTVIPAIAAIGAPVLAVVAAIAAVIAIIVVCVKHWDEIKEAAGKAVDFMSEKWSQFKEFLGKVWDGIKEKTKETVSNMSQKWGEFKTNVTNRWQETKDSVNAVNNLIAQHVSNRFNQIKSNTINEVNAMRTGAVNGFNNLRSGVLNVVSNVYSNVSNRFLDMKNTVSSRVDGIKNSAVNAFNNMRSGISNVMGTVYSTIVSGFSNAVRYITSLPSQAWGWGRDIISGIVDGIRSAFSWLTDAVSDIADTIASYIHFSEPDKGALKDFHTFMPDMMRQMAQGIRDGIPQLESAMDSMTQSMVPTMGGATTNNTNNTQNSVSLNVYGAQGQDVNELARVIEDKITNNVVRRGVVFG